jgi:hypothetical protein
MRRRDSAAAAGPRGYRADGRAGAFLAGLLLCLALAGCAGAPVTEFRTYSRAAEEVGLATLKLHNDYELARTTDPTKPPPGTGPVPLTYDPQAASGQGDPSVELRRNAIAVIREYNSTMLFLAEGGSYRAVQSRVSGLAGLLGSVFPAASLAAPIVGQLAGQLERARSAAEFRRALAAAILPGENCGVAAPVAAARGEALDDPLQLAACEPIIRGIYAILKADTATFYAAQYGLYKRTLDRLGREFIDKLRATADIAGAFARPANGAALERLAALEGRIADAGDSLFNRFTPWLLTTAAAGPPLSDAALTALAASVDELAQFARRHDKLKQAMRDYRAQLDAYVQLVEKSEDYLNAVEEAAVKPVDNLARVEQAIRLGIEIESGAVRTRDGLTRAFAILLGGGI